MRLLLPIALCSLLCSSAAAQPGAPAPMPPPGPPPGPPPALKSTGTGVGLAIAGSVIPAVAFGIGWSLDDGEDAGRVVAVSIVGGLILPSAGFYYAKKKKSPGQYPRAGALITLVIAALSDGLGEDGEADKWYGITAALYGVGCVIDIALTPGAVRDHNARYLGPAPVTLAPTVVPGGAGLALTGQF